MHDSKRKVEKSEEDIRVSFDEKDEDKKYSWPNSDNLVYKCTSEGIYTVEVLLYDYDEYNQDKNTATLYSTYIHTVYCEQLKIRHEFRASDGNTQWAEIEIVSLPFWTDTMPGRWKWLAEMTRHYITKLYSNRRLGT